MMKTVPGNPVPHHTKAILAANAVMALMVIGGIIAWYLQLTQGLQNTNLGTQQVWGIYISGFMLFTGVAAGGLIFAGAPHLFRLTAMKPFTPLFSFAAFISAAVAASLFIIVDVGGPARAFHFLTSGNLSSPMYWDFLLLSVYVVFSLVFTIVLIRAHHGKHAASTVNGMAVIAMLAGAAVMLTAFVFSSLRAHPYWNTLVQPVSFLVTALLATSAVFIILMVIVQKNGYVKPNREPVLFMGKIMLILAGIEAVFWGYKVMTGLMASGEANAMTMWQIAGGGSAWFWLQTVFLLAALLLAGYGVRTKTTPALLISAWAAFFATFLMKTTFLLTAFFNPALAYPGQELYGASDTYLPSLSEILIALGIMSLAVLLFQIGLKNLSMSQPQRPKAGEAS